MTADGLIKTLRAIKFKKFRSLTELSKEDLTELLEESLDIEGKDSGSNDNFDD